MSSSTSYTEQSSKSVVLTVKANQNMAIDMDSSKYPVIIQPLIECLKFSKLATALTASAQVPLVHLSTAFSTSIYTKQDETITFEVAGHKTSVSLNRFRKLFKLPTTVHTVNPDSISSIDIHKVFYRMGYSGDIIKLSNFKKSHLPPVWNGLFTLLFKSLSERVAGSDSASKQFCTLMYGLFTGEAVDFGLVLWSQLCQSIGSSSRHTEISCARFWAVIVDKCLQHFHVPAMADPVMAQIPIFQPNLLHLTDPANFDFMASIPDEMTDTVPVANVIISKYTKTTVSGERLIPIELALAMEAAAKSKRGGKRKQAESEASPTPKKKRSKKKKGSSSQHQEEGPQQETEEAPRNTEESPPEEEEAQQSPPPKTPQPSPKRTPSPHKSPSPKLPSPPKSPQKSQSPIPSPPRSPSPTPNQNQSPARSDDFLYGDDDEDLTGFVAKPFIFTADEEEESDPKMSSAQFTDLNKKLDTILTSLSNQNSKDMESVLAANTKMLQESAKAVADSEKSLAETTTKVETLNKEVKAFMETFQTLFDSNTVNVNKMIKNFGDNLSKEKKALEQMRKEMREEHTIMIAEVNSKITALKANLTMEANLMDALAEKTSRLSNKSLRNRVLQEKLETLTSEKAVFSSSLSEVISFISKVLETNDSVLTPSVRQHLTDKLTPAIQLLKQLVSVSEIRSVSKQGGEEKKNDDKDDAGGSDAGKKGKEKEDDNSNPESEARKEPETEKSAEEDPKAPSTGEASGSRKRKKIGEDDVDEDDESENIGDEERKKEERAKKDKLLDDLNELRKRLDEQDARALEAKLDLETRKILFPTWDVRRMLLEAIEPPKQLWLEPAVSFDLSNSLDSQLDFPTTPRAFLF